ncbi:glycosyltransferase family 25 protein [uncultured Helicobacter sp.]|mgnify:CR=1 FL=1|uniref:glycosyltransferase family 25 protein n=5 Tax=uncultured Helicobacter sp. TaxID=175537 RepID=UPI0025FAA16F|nr:glycosyltransferase family 25 protein [uncultured Helicobacter sp.]
MNIFIVNLKRAKERKALMQKQFERMSATQKQQYNIIFFEAIDAKAGEHLAFKQYSKIASILFRGKEMSDGERACFASHYSLWQKCVELNEPIIVLEDDVEMIGDFWNKIAHIATSEYVYVRLMYLKENAYFYTLPDDFYVSFDSAAGTQGYYLTPLAARTFIESARIWYRPVDDYMDMFYIHHIPAVCVTPILRELSIETTIDGRESKIKWYVKIIREITRAYFECKKMFFLGCSKKSLLLPKNALQSLQIGVKRARF